MDDCTRQDPAYRLAKERPRFGGAFLICRLDRSVRGDRRPGEVVRANQLPVPQLEDLDQAHPKAGPAGRAVADDLADHRDVIAGVDELVNLDREVPELLDQLPLDEPLEHVLAAAIDRAVRERGELMPLDVRVDELAPGIEVTAVERLVGRPCTLDVRAGHQRSAYIALAPAFQRDRCAIREWSAWDNVPVTERELLERIDAHMVDTGEFMRELTLRNERFTQEAIRRLSAQTDELIAGRKVLDDLHEASREHTRIIANLIDELRERGLGGASA